MNIERAHDLIVEEIMRNQHKSYPLHDILDSFCTERLSALWQQPYSDWPALMFVLEEHARAIVARFVRVNLAAEVLELAAELQADAETEARER